MSITAALLAGAILAGWGAPAALRRLTALARDPLAALICWLASIAAVLGTFTAGTALLLLPGHGPTGSLAEVVSGCWAALRHGQLPALDEVAGLPAAAIVLVLVARFGHAARGRLRARRRTYRTHVDVLNILGHHEPGPSPVVWLEHPEPVAYSLGGRPGLVVVTTGMRRLPARALDAVLCHERAHLRGRHHALVTVTDALAAAVPFVPLFRHALTATRLLVELVADAAAVRACGRSAVRAALLALTGAAGSGGPAPALAMADHEITTRLQRLTDPAPPPGPGHRALTRAAAALAPAVSPGLLGLGTIVLAVALSCPIA